MTKRENSARTLTSKLFLLNSMRFLHPNIHLYELIIFIIPIRQSVGIDGREKRHYFGEVYERR